MMAVVAANFSDVSYAMGAADSLIETCDYLSCSAQCLQ
jgi:hypothetical protein